LNVFDLFAKISLDTSEYTAGLTTAGSTLGGFATKFTNTLADLSKKFFAFGSDCVKVGADFDKAMSKVAATLGKTTDEVTDLRDFAREMGSTTAFTAEQAAEALNFMALAGYDAEKSMEMLPIVLNLAAAGNMDLAKASDMVTDAQTALGLSFEDTKTLVDQMAKTASSSNTSVAQLGEAILTMGANAKGMKGGTLELVTLLGELADNGIKGSEAGTKLRNMLSALPGKSEDAQLALDELGVALYDSEGNMRNLNDVLLDFDKATKNMTQEKRDSYIRTIFNARDLAAAKSLIDSAATSYTSLTEKIKDSNGAAEQMAKTQLDNLEGDVTIFQSALSDLKISVSDLVTPKLRDAVRFATQSIGDLQRYTTAFRENGFSGIADTFRKDFEKLKADAPDLIGNFLKEIPKKAGEIKSAGISILDTLLSPLKENSKEIGETAVTFITSFASSISNDKVLENIGAVAGDVIFGVANGLSSRESIDAFMEAAPKFVTGLVDGIKDFLIGDTGETGLLGAVESIINNVAEWFENPKNMDEFNKAADSFIMSLGESMLMILDKIPKILLSAGRLLLDVLIGNIDYDHGANEFWDSLLSSIWNSIKRVDLPFGGEDIHIQESWQKYNGDMSYDEFKNKWYDVEDAGDALLGISDAERARKMGYAIDVLGNVYDPSTGLSASDWEKVYNTRAQYGNRVKNYSDSDLLEWIEAGTTMDFDQFFSDYERRRRYKEKHPDQYVPGFAEGGIVSKPTLAWIGERGEKEAVVPLEHETETSRMLGLGGGITIQFGDIYVSGMDGKAGNEIVRQIDEALRVWQIQKKRGTGDAGWQL